VLMVASASVSGLSICDRVSLTFGVYGLDAFKHINMSVVLMYIYIGSHLFY
jgi:hypothetical protein